MPNMPIPLPGAEPKKRGRPRKIRPGEAETPATQVSPVAETSENPVRVGVDEIDPVSGDVIAVYDDPGDEVELPQGGDAGKIRRVNAEGTGVEWVYPDAGEAVESPEATYGDTGVVKHVWHDPSVAEAFDHDHDGHPGGSLPHAKLSDLQVVAYTRDAMDVYMGQHEVKRADAWNRVWTMRHEILRNHDNMMVRCERGPNISERFIPASQMSSERAEEAVRDVDRETGR